MITTMTIVVICRVDQVMYKNLAASKQKEEGMWMEQPASRATGKFKLN